MGASCCKGEEKATMPGGIVCSVATCKNNSKKAKETGENLLFFTFPKDPRVCKEWERKCLRKDKWSSKNKRVCSKHFKLEDYEDEMQARLMNLTAKKLKKDAIPSLFLLSSEDEKPTELTSRANRALQKERKTMVDELLNVSVLEPPLDNTETDENVEISYITPTLSNETNQGCEECEILRSRLEALQNENVMLKQKILAQENVERLLENQIKKEQRDFADTAKVAFNDFLTSNQLDIVLKKKAKARWTTEELSRAFTLRYFSKRAYIYLRNSLHFPLPGISTLQQWAANINLTSGILEDVLQIMNRVGETKTKMSRITVLSFDEVKVSKLYEYCEKDDEIIGPHSYMQVVMARGLFEKWKQPVFLGFDKKMTRELLENIICCLSTIHYDVAACVSDCGSSNQGLWRELGITVEKTYIKHCVTKKPIYFFADVPHLLKLLRNWFLDTGFIYNEKIINKEPVKHLINMTRTEVSSCHKLTPLHINVEKTQRQNVRLAGELFSNTTSTALKHYLPGEDKVAAKEVGNFIELVNSWFDIMNSYTLSSSIPLKKPYGTNLQCQNDVLDEMLATVENMRCVGKNSLQVFQKGIIISTNSLKHLYETMKEEFTVKYILTHKLNQDCLENFFSQVRSRGGLHDHPSPVNAIYRVRMLLLGKNPGLVQSHANVNVTKETKDEQFILASAVKQARLGTIDVPQPGKEQELPYDDVETNSTSSSSSSFQLLERKQSEMDGLMYIAGYLAKKHKERYPNLGMYTYKTGETMSIHNYSIPSWIQHLSFGGLIQPSEEWSNQVIKMDKYFVKMHKDVFSCTKQIVKNTTNYICDKIKDVPRELVKSFCRQRIFVRIKYLNLKNEEEKAQKRKASVQSRAVSKKIKKILN